ncbi:MULTISPECIES: hypothetical protein [unclassified Cysteiniphilum]|uniref:hypothetical protein n=1 Tax=Cysteiniphilum TaxID=2056696 RepID=UPI001245AAC9|nr:MULTISPECIES: hypothetical protein [unclassified Cysteiniphilum]WHN65617.1 hypothetical protein NYP54_11375 [Cysteiniphilum sp. QT6929]
MEKFIQEVLVIFVILTALVVLYHVFIFLFWILLVAIGVAIVYRVIKFIVSLFSSKKSNTVEHEDL